MSEKNVVRVRDVMKTEFDLVDGMDTVADVLRNSKYPESKCFIVDMRHDDDEYGIVLLSDIAKQVLAKDKAPERVNIYEIMSKPVVAVDPDMDIRYCTRLFENFGLSRTPVVDNKKLVGIVGYTDIVLRGLRDHLT
ncbi:MAG: CBS domain-containing protein [Gammaproteobacteria bacterium]|nr:CBS domain-containing protein [Gammaproteobacteria bacterium]